MTKQKKQGWEERFDEKTYRDVNDVKTYFFNDQRFKRFHEERKWLVDFMEATKKEDKQFIKDELSRARKEEKEKTKREMGDFVIDLHKDYMRGLEEERKAQADYMIKDQAFLHEHYKAQLLEIVEKMEGTNRGENVARREGYNQALNDIKKRIKEL